MGEAESDCVPAHGGSGATAGEETEQADDDGEQVGLHGDPDDQ